MDHLDPTRRLRGLLPATLGCLAAVLGASEPRRVPVLGQIALPHSYYYREIYLPQLTSGPSAVTWTPDGRALIYSMQGSLWRQDVASDAADQLTDDEYTDYQPDCSPDGQSVAFVRYDGRAMELMLLDLATGSVRALTANGAVNVEPRWSPDGRRLAYVSTADTGHFLLQIANVSGGRIVSTLTLTPDRKSAVPRYYYSPFDHAINPAWTRDGKEILFVSNREIAHGTGDLVRMAVDRGAAPRLVQHEETSWRTRPDVSPDGTRIVYSSYLGRQWQQLWVLPVDGGYPFPLTYGEYDNINPRWSPDGRSIAFISNRDGNTSLWVVDAFSGEQRPIRAVQRRYRRPRRTVVLRVRDESGNPLPARVSVTDARGRFYAPDDAWIHADDLIVRERQRIESRYFHASGDIRMSLPAERLTVSASHGPEYEVATLDVDGSSDVTLLPIGLKRIAGADFGSWWNGDLHVHMNYGGHYRNTPARLAAQARAEDVDIVYNLVVNKEQRVPDIAAFRTDPDPASKPDILVLHGQEFHSSYWGHLGLLNLASHLLLPDYTAYPFTGVASPYPHNAVIAEMAHRQQALVGYVHPFDEDVDPNAGARLTNALPIDAALGRVDYYEAVGFADTHASSAVWYRLLNCGINLPAAAGTDAMANYASLRGPVGLNRVYVPARGSLTRETFLEGIKNGRGVATNGPLLRLQLGGAEPGDTVRVGSEGHTFSYRVSMWSNFPVDHLELVSNGVIAERFSTGSNRQHVDVEGKIRIAESAWILIRAWNDGPHPHVLDTYPYATTSPVYVEVGGQRRRSAEAGRYFMGWVDKITADTVQHADYRTPAEKEAVLADAARARAFYEGCSSTMPAVR